MRLARVVLPSRTADGDPAPALRFGDPRAQTLLAALGCFQRLFHGLSNQSLRALVASFLPGYTPRQMTYDLRRLRANGLLVGIEGTPPSPAEIAERTPIARSWRAFERALNDRIADAALAA